ncbi:GerAB/ArcD/ProY family transporter [Metabacillus fastidiosus]|uniref:GerAB/ArcD/ProY family transporter n=1 Tax=Metabacillus fastidiosus TaxID=1458 RepID=UPI000B12837D|nr:GerAB/ArcD/ProY family transporter [Metabacillus fastidiosus]MED4463556.1 GerAB/ArcD/ProY family transporter [Metabacillus fastidiosus]
MIQIPEKNKVSHFLVFYLIHCTQFGVAVLGFQPYIVEKAGNDAWISIIIAGLYVHLLIWMIYKILEGANGNIVTVHQELFGKKLGNMLNLLFCLYFLVLGISALAVFIDLIRVWMFPDVNIWAFAFFFLALVYYIVMSGFRIVTGIAFFGVILPSYIFIIFLFPLQFSSLMNLFPMFSHSFIELLKGAKEVGLSMLGFEALLVFYPFLKNPSLSKKWAHIGAAFTTSTYLLIMLVSMVFFSQAQLQENIWPTLTMWKIVEFPFLERFEYVGIANWNLIILPIVCIAVWCSIRILKDAFHFKQKYMLIIILFLTYIFSNMLQTRVRLDVFKSSLGDVSFYLVYVYIPFLYIMSLVIRKIKEKRA